MAKPTFAFVAAPSAEAQAALAELKSRYGEADPVHAEILVVLGGDGTMLETLHRHMGRQVRIFGMNCGTVGFLMNRYSTEDLVERLERAQLVTLHPLEMRAKTTDGSEQVRLAINEVSLLRELAQAAKITIQIDGVEQISELICDGVMVATPGRQHRLQPLGPRPDPADRLGRAGADADQRLPAAALARRHPAADRQGALHHPRAAAPPGLRHRRLRRSPRCRRR